MNKEKRTIEFISKIMPRTAAQCNALFESDAEIVKFGQSTLLFTIDEFSAEDMLREDDPYILGWNLAAGGVSDIFAAGGTPLFYAHSMVVNKNWSEEYIKEFCDGIAAVLNKTGASFIGGDFGQSTEWRYTATCIGEPISKPLLRSGAKAGEVLYSSGEIGAGNLEAALKLYTDKKIIGHVIKTFKNQFHLRTEEAFLINKYATSCIDTSDGAFNALKIIAEMSNVGFEVSGLPYVKAGVLAAKLISLPKTLLFLGECGEYELIFTIKKENEDQFVTEAKRGKFTFYKIGEVTSSMKKILVEDSKKINLENINISARDFADVSRYMSELRKALKDNKL